MFCVCLRIKGNSWRAMSYKCEMIKLSFENRFWFEKSLAILWRILESTYTQEETKESLQ